MSSVKGIRIVTRGTDKLLKQSEGGNDIHYYITWLKVIERAVEDRPPLNDSGMHSWIVPFSQPTLDDNYQVTLMRAGRHEWSASLDTKREV